MCTCVIASVNSSHVSGQGYKIGPVCVSVCLCLCLLVLSGLVVDLDNLSDKVKVARLKNGFFEVSDGLTSTESICHVIMIMT